MLSLGVVPVVVPVVSPALVVSLGLSLLLLSPPQPLSTATVITAAAPAPRIFFIRPSINRRRAECHPAEGQMSHATQRLSGRAASYSRVT